MPPASPLSQATSSVTRLLKDLDSYDKELADQKTSLENLQADTTTTGGAEGDDDDEAGNREYLVKQQAQAMKETQAVFKPLLERLGVASGKLEQELSSRDADAAEVGKAQEALALAVQKQTSSTREGV